MSNIEFIIGMKVSLEGEVGVVLVPELDQPDFCGMIR